MRRALKAVLLATLLASSPAVRSGSAGTMSATPPTSPRRGSPARAGASSAPAPADDRVAVLSNGLRVVFLESRSNPMIASTVAVLSGVRDETPATNGASHFLEHMLFDGTTTRSQEQIQRDVEFIGGYNNATTRDELTLFMMLVHRDKLERGLDVQADMLFHSTIPADALERERKVVLEELARDTSEPGYGPEQFFKSRYYAGSARAMPVLGSAASVGAITRDAVFAHYKKNYRPERMVLFLAGDFDRETVLPLLEKTFGAAGSASAGTPGAKAATKASPKDATKAATKAARNTATKAGTKAATKAATKDAASSASGSAGAMTAARSATVAMPGAPAAVRGATRPGLYREHIDGDRGYLRIGIVAPGVGDPDAAAYGALAGLLGSGPGSRLAHALMGVEETGTIDAASDYVPGAGEGRLEIQATLKPGSNGFAAIRAIRRELGRLAVETVPVEELRAYVAEAASDSVYLRDQVHYLGMSVGSDLILGPRPSLGVEADDLAALTPQTLRAVAQRWLADAGGARASARALRRAQDGAAAVPATPEERTSTRTSVRLMVVTLSSPSVPAVADPDGADPIPEPAPFPSPVARPAPAATASAAPAPATPAPAAPASAAPAPAAPASAASAPAATAPAATAPAATAPAGSVPGAPAGHGAPPSPAAHGESSAATDAAPAAHGEASAATDVPPGSGLEAPGATPVTTAPPSAAPRTKVQRAVFENGLTVLVGENADSQVFAAHVLIRDRAAMEPAEMTGIADVLHRTLPYGSLYLDGEGLSLKLKTIGARLKTVDDAGIPYDDYYTSPRYSYVRFETTHANWREGLGLLFTTIAYPRLDDTDVALAVSEEIDLSRKRQETPAAAARDLYAKTVMKDGPLARPVTGTPVSLAAIKIEDLRRFHERYFSPDRLVLSIVSDVPASDVFAVLHATFGRMKRLAAEAPAAGASQPPLTEKESRAEIQTGRAQSQILMGRVFAREDEDFPALVVAATVLSQAIGRELRDARGLAYSAGCALEDYGDRSWFTASIGTRPENAAEAENAIRDAIRAFPGKELDEAVVERAVNSMRGSVAMRRMTRISQAYSLGFNELLGRTPDFDAQLDARLASVRAADVKRVVAKYLDSDRMVTAVAK